jgi:hypothetical protein
MYLEVVVARVPNNSSDDNEGRAEKLQLFYIFMISDG